MKAFLAILCFLAAILVFLAGCLYLGFSILLSYGGVHEDGSTVFVLLGCVVLCGALAWCGTALLRTHPPSLSAVPPDRRPDCRPSPS